MEGDTCLFSVLGQSPGAFLAAPLPASAWSGRCLG